MNKATIPVEQGGIYNLKIEDITATGEGVAKHESFTVFVEDAVPGDEVEAKITLIKPNYAKADILTLNTASEMRRDEKVCPYEDYCGGCPYLNIKYDNQLEIKEKTVKDALERIGGLANIELLPIIGSDEFHYRNKAQYKVSDTGLGFYKKGTHELVEIDSCLIQSEAATDLMEKLNDIIKKYKLSPYDENKHKGILRSLLIRTNREGESIVVFVINQKKLPLAKDIALDLQKLPNVIGAYVNVNERKGNTILGKKTSMLFEKKKLTEKIGNKIFTISPTSFFQVNPDQTEKLYGVVKDFADLKPGETVFDLYCGTGTIGLYLSDDDINLIGVEINPDAIEDAQKNADANGVRNAKFLVGAAEKIAPGLDAKPDCVILDPPRKGCDSSLLELLLDLKAKRIVYVSCNPATLARDIKILSKEYTVKKVQPVDMFPQTGHVETVALLIRKD